jgi:LemA protein
MKPSFSAPMIALVSALGVLVFGGLWYVSTGNNLINLDEGVNTASSQVDNVYQRRADLIPNLVNTVKGYAKHEAEVLQAVTEARASVGQIKLNNVKSAEDLQKYEASQYGLSSALSRLMVVAEKYPDLKADKNFLELQSQLEGTENRITVERQRFNETVQKFNVAVRQFPSSIVAGAKGFTQKQYFQAAAGAKEAPKVSF